VRLPIDTSRWT